MNEAKMFSNKFGDFENINISYDEKSKKSVVGLSLGGIYITEEDEIISTVLGSCVSACARDTVIGIVGMNHFMVAGNKSDISKVSGHRLFQYGLFSMDYMLNKILHLGGSKQTMEKKYLEVERLLLLQVMLAKVIFVLLRIILI